MTRLFQTVRRLYQTPGYSLTALLTLALGVGASTVVLSFVNGVLIKPLPYPDSDRLVALVHRSRTTGEALPASTATYFTYGEHNRVFQALALWLPGTVTVTGDGDPEVLRSLVTTHEFLPLLGVTPILGRGFSAEDDKLGSPRTVILSHAYWQRRFGGSADALGTSMLMDGQPRTVIGVLPADFRFSQQPDDVIVPMQPNRFIAYVGPRGENGIARLRDGVTMDAANADVARMLPILQTSFPPPPGVSPDLIDQSNVAPNLMTLRQYVVDEIADVLWFLTGTVTLLMLIACANIANLQLVRTDRRAHEIAIQSALGASQGAIARVILLESLVLAFLGGAVGCGFASLATPALVAFVQDHLPRATEVAIDFRVVGLSLAISLGAGLLCGILPAARYSVRPNASSILQGTGRSVGVTRERHRARSALVAVQIALAIVLLVAAGLMIRSFDSLRQVDPGFQRPETVLTVDISIHQANFDDVRRMQAEIQDRLAAITGVDSAAFVSTRPFRDGPNAGFLVEGAPPSDMVPTEFRFISPRYFETLGTPLVAGRTFLPSDTQPGHGQVTIVSENVARGVWGSPAEALGKRVRATERAPWQEIVGVVGDVHHEGVNRSAPWTWYRPMNDSMAQWMSRTVSFVVRSERVDRAGFLEEVQQAIWSVNRSVPLASVQTLGDAYEASMAQTYLTLVLLAVTGTMALALGLIGIYGVISYVLANRAKEAGVRMALGARSEALIRMYLRQSLMPLAAGLILGLGTAMLCARFIQRLLFNVSAWDPITYVVVSVTIAAAGLLACYLPIRRVARVSPVDALRLE